MANKYFGVREAIFIIGLSALGIAIAGGFLAAAEAAILTSSEDIGQPERINALGKLVLGVSAMLGGSIVTGRIIEAARR